MKNIMRYLAAFLAVLFLGTSIYPTAVWADTTKTYMVTVRAGDVGTFDTDKISGNAHENYITFEVTRGESLATMGYFSDDASFNSTMRNIVSVGDGYMLLDLSGVAAQTITKNTDYVLDYAKLVDPVVFTIYYVDSASGEQIAAPTIAYGNEGDEIPFAPVAVANYATTDAATTLTLAKDAENSVTFHYTSTLVAGTVTNTVTTTSPASTVTVTETNQVEVAAPAAANVVAANAGAANANANAAGAGAAEGGQVIAEEEVPLGGGEAEAENGENSSGGEESGTAEIAEEEIPLGAESSGTVSLAVYLGGLAIVAMLAGAAVAYAKSKKKK